MKHNPKNPKLLNRTKKIAATVAALGAAIGVNMSDVLAGAADLQVTESGKAAISSQKIKKPDVLADKSSAGPLKRRPSAAGAKVERQGIKNRLGVQGDKSGIIIEDRPGATSNKLGK